MPPIKCLAQSTPVVRKEVKINYNKITPVLKKEMKMNDNKVIVIDSSDSEHSDNCAENDVSFSSDSEIKFPIKCVAESIVNRKVPKLKEPETVSKDNDVIIQNKNNGSISSSASSHEHQDELQELLSHPEELTFEFELLVRF